MLKVDQVFFNNPFYQKKNFEIIKIPQNFWIKGVSTSHYAHTSLRFHYIQNSPSSFDPLLIRLLTLFQTNNSLIKVLFFIVIILINCLESFFSFELLKGNFYRRNFEFFWWNGREVLIGLAGVMRRDCLNYGVKKAEWMKKLGIGFQRMLKFRDEFHLHFLEIVEFYTWSCVTKIKFRSSRCSDFFRDPIFNFKNILSLRGVSSKDPRDPSTN